MCVICVYDTTNPIETSEVCEMIDENPDGFGIMYYGPNGQLITKKTYSRNIKELKAQALKMIANAEKIAATNKSQIAIHARIATHGEININNSHPFKFAGGYALMHNGIIRGYGSKKVSDTLAYSQFLTSMNKRYPGIIEDADFLDMVGDQIGGSKFVIARPTISEFIIVNRNQGQRENGRWYSNLKHRFVPTKWDKWSDWKYDKNGSFLFESNKSNKGNKGNKSNSKSILSSSKVTELSPLEDHSFYELLPMEGDFADLRQAPCDFCEEEFADYIDYDGEYIICQKCKDTQMVNCSSCGEPYDLDLQLIQLCPSCEQIMLGDDRDAEVAEDSKKVVDIAPIVSIAN